jgi:glycosyltransferase involved in cell wall biosynthesis
MSPAVDGLEPRPRLLFLCQTLPYPPDGGVMIRTYHVLRLLARRYDVHALCFFRRSTARGVESAVRALREHATTVEAFPIPQEWSRGRFLWDHARSVLGRRVYTRFAYESTAFLARLRALRQEGNFAVAHVDSLDLSGYLSVLDGLPIACVHHNVESALLARRSTVETSVFKRRYLSMQAGLMQAEEERCCPSVALNVVCSADDRAILQRIVPGVRTAIVPNGVDIGEFTPGPQSGVGIVFVGGMTWFPNRDCLEYFAESILPELARTGPVPTINWVGRALPGATEHYANSGITLTGYVDSIVPWVQDAACFIVPLRVGGGTRLKILSAWAMGKAVVSTSIGCEGLDARDGWNILVRDDPREFAAAVRQVLTDEVLRAHLAENARRTAVEVYSWDRIGEHMLREYQSLERRQ